MIIQFDSVTDLKSEVFWQLWWLGILQEGLDESLSLPLGDHAAASGGHGHGPGPPQNLQLHRRALNARDTQRHAPVVDLVVAVVLQQRVGDLSQAQPVLAVDVEGHDEDAVQHDLGHLQGVGRRLQS